MIEKHNLGPSPMKVHMRTVFNFHAFITDQIGVVLDAIWDQLWGHSGPPREPKIMLSPRRELDLSLFECSNFGPLWDPSWAPLVALLGALFG